MKTTSNDKLAHYYVDDKKYKELLQRFAEDEQSLNEAYKAMRAESNLPMPTPDEIRTFTAFSIQDFIRQERDNYIKSFKVLPQGTKERIIAEYEGEWERVQGKAITLENAVLRNIDITLHYDAENDQFFYDEDEKSNSAQKSAGMKTTTEMREAYQVYRELYEALKKAHDWEEYHGWRFATEGNVITFPDGNGGNICIASSIYDLLDGSMRVQGKREVSAPFDDARFMTLYGANTIGRDPYIKDSPNENDRRNARLSEKQQQQDIEQ